MSVGVYECMSTQAYMYLCMSVCKIFVYLFMCESVYGCMYVFCLRFVCMCLIVCLDVRVYKYMCNSVCTGVCMCKTFSWRIVQVCVCVFVLLI